MYNLISINKHLLILILNIYSAFENHDHVYKRTYPLKNNQVVADGTIYLGDGAWGVLPHYADPSRWYLEKAVSGTNYYLLVNLHSWWLHASAYDVSRTCIDDVMVFS